MMGFGAWRFSTISVKFWALKNSTFPPIWPSCARENGSRPSWRTIITIGPAYAFASIPEIDPWASSFGGYIEVKAESLRYESVIAALEAGHFYASMGPEFKELYIADGVLHIQCSPVRSIGVATMCRTGYSRWSRTDTFTEAEFRLRGNEEFVVVTLTDLSGRKAVSQAYWLA